MKDHAAAPDRADQGGVQSESSPAVADIESSVPRGDAAAAKSQHHVSAPDVLFFQQGLTSEWILGPRGITRGSTAACRDLTQEEVACPPGRVFREPRCDRGIQANGERAGISILVALVARGT